MVSGNVLVIMSVVRERTLQNMTNFFIVSLASADLLVAGLVMPFTIYAMVSIIDEKGVYVKMALKYFHFVNIVNFLKIHSRFITGKLGHVGSSENCL